ncbi:Chitinase 1 [Aphanomyces cochlioides]|nr:Chitinase 1 [Aphanomyces cochlioides]
MKPSTVVGSLVALAATTVQVVDAHGRLIDPPHRGYIGKLPQFSYIPKDYSDNVKPVVVNMASVAISTMACANMKTGGIYGTFPTNRDKAIGACYAPGSTIDIQVQITANHKGYFEFGLCKLNGLNDKVTESCFQSLVQPNGDKQWPLPAGAETFAMQYQLPSRVECNGDSHCVLRWWYVGGNNPGVGINGQEQFWNCADIYISKTCGSNPPPSPSSNAPVTSRPQTKTPTPSQPQPKPSPSSSSPTPSSFAPPSGDCVSCTNCYYAPTNACYVGWTEAQCKSIPFNTWCGSKGKSKAASKSIESTPIESVAATKSQCGSCTNCYYAPTNACFVGWTQSQCSSVSSYTWCGSGGANPPSSPPATQKPSRKPPSTPSPKPPSTPSSKPPSSSSPPSSGGSGLAKILPKSLFQQIFPNALSIYKYENLIAMAAKYPGFANSGNSDVDRREVAAFLGQVALETGNLQYVEEINKGDYCQPSAQYPCAAGQRYFGRGAIQLSWNYNYKDFGDSIGQNLVSNPGLVASDANLVWWSAMWFWNADKWNGNIHKVVGYPVGFAKATNIINGGLECGLHPANPDSEKVRIASFVKYCQLLGVSPGDNLSCQTSAFGAKMAVASNATESTSDTTESFHVAASNSCGSCNNCYYAPNNACFVGWTQSQCASVLSYTWCGSGGNHPPPASSTIAPRPTSSPTKAPTPSTSKPSQPGVTNTVSWNWFATSTTVCDASLSADTLNRGFYVGGENIPADCGKTATLTYNGHTVTATYAWRTTGGQQYHELSPQAFAKLIGSSANVANFNSASAFQAAINDPGRVTAKCSGTC